MSKRFKMSHGSSRKVFSQGARRVHPKNNLQTGNPMRGGIRL